MSSPPPPPPPSLSAIAYSSPPIRLSNIGTSRSPSFGIDSQSPLLGADAESQLRAGSRPPSSYHFCQSRSQSQAPNDNNNDNADDDNHSLPATPPPEPVNLWTKDEAMKLVAFLSTSQGPLAITDVAEHMDRPIAHVAAMAVSV
ncbi:uncharacterized protein LY79DRAFT_572699 [Colletotrichum navitas]|uniref:Uncharacterized protein n=1 Tax=Colletotrichum navitas TaxID=681940 RepID=A0AAD8PJV0_9PEZI|nr:uncharacterized protein LY79DRAFT_572699 [Colletotrichum navitas]KAK1566116.1 hypothetical protein LY79DRAFT_572699 [Colletotrichum navitas]